MSAQVTEAHRELSRRIMFEFTQAGTATASDVRMAAQLIADSEAKAIGLHAHVATQLAAVLVECGAPEFASAEHAMQWAKSYLDRAERAEAILGKLQELHGCSQGMVVHWCAHAANRSIGLDEAQAELATEREKVRVLRSAMKFIANDDNYMELYFDPCELASEALAATEENK